MTRLSVRRSAQLAVVAITISALIPARGVLASTPTPFAGAGTTAYAFLRLPINVRAAAMGGSGVAIAERADAILVNPAALADVTTSGGFAQYANHLTDIQSGSVAYALNVTSDGRAGLGVTYLNFGGLTRTNDQAAVIGTFGAYDLAISAGYAQPVTKELSAGGAAKFIVEGIDAYTSTAFALDAGLLWAPNSGRTRFGLALQNVGFQSKSFSDTHRDALPMTATLGWFQKLKGAPFNISVEARAHVEGYVTAGVGVEFNKLEPFYLRVGYNTLGLKVKTGSSSDGFAGLAAGLGYNWDRLSIDYAFSSLAGLGSTHRIGVSIAL